MKKANIKLITNTGVTLFEEYINDFEWLDKGKISIRDKEGIETIIIVGGSTLILKREPFEKLNNDLKKN